MRQEKSASTKSQAKKSGDSAAFKRQATRTRTKASKPASQPAGKKASKPRPEKASPDEKFTGKLHNTRADSPVRLAACSRAFEMYALQRRTFVEIGRELGIDRHTVSAYIEEESQRRSKETAQIRFAAVHRTLCNIDEVERFYFDKMYSPQCKGDEGRTILEAQKQRVTLLGLDPGIVIKDERESTNPFAQIRTAAEALEVLKSIPERGIPR